LGFFTGTSKLFTSAGGSISAWDLSLQNPVRQKAFATGFNECYNVAYGGTGRKMSLISYGNLREIDPDTGRSTGVKLSAIKTYGAYYNADETMLYLNELTRSGARHLHSLKIIGQNFGECELHAVSPDGRWIVTVDPRKRVQLWQIPEPMKGSLAEVEKTLADHLGTLHPDGDRPMFMPAEQSVALLPLTVAEYREIHNAGLGELTKWFAEMPKNFRPTHLSVHEGSNGKRFDAIAVDDGTAAPFEAHLGLSNKAAEPRTLDQDYQDMNKQGWNRILLPSYFDSTGYRRHHIWSKSNGYSTAWRVEKDYEPIIAKLKESQKMPVAVVQYDDTLALTTAPDDGHKWEFHKDLSAEQVKTKIEECKNRKWRPTMIHRHRTENDKFLLMLIDNPHDEAWEYDANLSVNEYETIMGLNKARGFRPEYVHSWVVNRDAVYSVIWVRSVLAQQERPPKPPGDPR
jgi:hypothetical protein